MRREESHKFLERFEKHRKFLKEKLSLLDFLMVQRNKVDRNKNLEDFNNFLKLADEIEKIINDKEKEFLVLDEENLKELCRTVNYDSKSLARV